MARRHTQFTIDGPEDVLACLAFWQKRFAELYDKADCPSTPATQHHKVNGGYTLVGSPMSPFQMAEVRKALMRLPPSSISMPTCNAYSNRRCLPGIAQLLQLPVTKDERRALGNWLDRMDMAEH